MCRHLTRSKKTVSASPALPRPRFPGRGSPPWGGVVGEGEDSHLSIALLDSSSLSFCFIASYDFQIGQRSFLFVLFESLPIFLLSFHSMRLSFLSPICFYVFLLSAGWHGCQENDEDNMSLNQESVYHLPSSYLCTNHF